MRCGYSDHSLCISNPHCQLENSFFKIPFLLGLKRWHSSYEHCLLFQRTRFPAPM